MRLTLPGFVSLLLLAGSPALGAVEITPMLGVGKPTGEGSDGYNMGLGLAVAVGGRFSPQFSLDGALGVDRMSVADVPANVDVSAYLFRLQVVPAFHFVQNTLDFSLGPSVGLYSMRLHSETVLGEGTITNRGYDLGARLALLVTVNPMVALGPFFTYTRLWATKICIEASGREACDEDPDNDDAGFWSLGLAARF